MANSRVSAQGLGRVPHVRIIPPCRSLVKTETKGWSEADRTLVLGVKAGTRDANVRMLIRGHAKREEVPDVRADCSKYLIKSCSVEESDVVENDNSRISFAVPSVNTSFILFERGISPNVVLLTQSRSPVTVFAYSTGAVGHLECPSRGYLVYPINDNGELPARWGGRMSMPYGLPGNDGALVPIVMGPPRARDPRAFRVIRAPQQPEAREVIDLTSEVEEGDHMDFDASRMGDFSQEGGGDPYAQ